MVVLLLTRIVHVDTPTTSSCFMLVAGFLTMPCLFLGSNVETCRDEAHHSGGKAVVEACGDACGRAVTSFFHVYVFRCQGGDVLRRSAELQPPQ